MGVGWVTADPGGIQQRVGVQGQRQVVTERAAREVWRLRRRKEEVDAMMFSRVKKGKAIGGARPATRPNAPTFSPVALCLMATDGVSCECSSPSQGDHCCYLL